MNEHSRRTFLIGTGAAAAVGTAAATGAVPAVTAAAVPKRGDRAPDQDPGDVAHGQVVAYVSDAAAGQVTVMRGADEVVLTDHALARRLAGEVR